MLADSQPCKNLDKLMQRCHLQWRDSPFFPELGHELNGRGGLEPPVKKQKRDKEVEILGFSLERHQWQLIEAFASPIPTCCQ